MVREVAKSPPRPDGPRLIGYARVSTAEQNLDMQVQALKGAGVHPDDIHVEKISASAKSRPKLKWALENLRPGDTLIVWKLDRFARSMQDLLNGLQVIQKAGGSFKSVTEQIDTSSAVGMLLVHVLGALAQFERDLTIYRTRAGVAAAKARGVMFGQPKKLDAKQLAQCRRWRREDPPKSYREIADLCKTEFGIDKISAQTVMVSLKRKAKK